MLSEELPGASDVVIHEQDDVARRDRNPCVPSGGWAPMLLFEHLKRARRFKRACVLRRSVFGSVYDEDDLIRRFRIVLQQERWKRSLQQPDSVVCGHNDRKSKRPVG
jgi:hypothetical protein